MKKFYLTLLFPFVAIGNLAAQQPLNFEPSGQGANYAWNMFENATNPALEFVANPFPTGINTSATVAKFTALQAGQPWAGTEINHADANGMPDWTLALTNAKIKIMVYKTVISPVKIKLVTPSGDALPEKSVSNTLINQWEELTFDFADYVGAHPVYDQIVIFPDFGTTARTQTNIVYFDNITFSTTVAPPPPPTPAVAAATPTAAAANVISLFSEAYPGIQMSTWLTVWSEAAHAEVQVQGNLTKKYSVLNFAGIEPAANINATSMGYFNFDAWSADFTQLRIKLVDFGANGVHNSVAGNDDSEHEITFATPPTQQWLHYSINLNDFVNMTGRANIKQIIFSTSNSATVFLDNIYFSTQSTMGTDVFTANKTVIFPNPAKDALTIRASNSIEKVTVYNTLGQQVLEVAPGVSEVTLNIERLQSGIYIVNSYSNGALSTKKFIKE